MDQLRDSFLSYLAVEKGLSRNTLESYGRDIGKFIHFFENKNISEVKDIKYNDILDFLSYLKNRASALLPS